MTIEEFNNTRFSKNTRIIYYNNICKIASVDFEEKLIAIIFEHQGEESGHETSWVRCENCTIQTP